MPSWFLLEDYYAKPKNFLKLCDTNKRCPINCNRIADAGDRRYTSTGFIDFANFGVWEA